MAPKKANKPPAVGKSAGKPVVAKSVGVPQKRSTYGVSKPTPIKRLAKAPVKPAAPVMSTPNTTYGTPKVPQKRLAKRTKAVGVTKRTTYKQPKRY